MNNMHVTIENCFKNNNMWIVVTDTVISAKYTSKISNMLDLFVCVLRPFNSEVI